MTKKLTSFISFLEYDRICAIIVGGWFDAYEGFFSKLTRQALKGIRVKSVEELIQRIYKYFDEVNADPVVYYWKYKLDEIDPDEKVIVETLPQLQSS